MSTQNTQYTPNREALEIDKLHAEFMNLLADLKHKAAEEDKIRAERERIRIEEDKMRAETLKTQAEGRWHPLVVGAGFLASATVFVGALAGGLAVFLKWLSAWIAK